MKTTAKLTTTELDTSWLIALVADCLGLSEEEIDPRVPLVRYGLDSVAAIQIATAISDKLGRPVADDLLLLFPDIESLVSCNASDHRSAWEQMQHDARLPSDIHPDTDATDLTQSRHILLTGATGFLGAYLLRELLQQTSAEIHCLVRAANADESLARIRDSLESYQLSIADSERRLHAIPADLARPDLGLSADCWELLAQKVDEIYHAGAVVNWVQGYNSLRDVNVLGTRTLLRLACQTRAKRFHFVSSLGVCYARQSPDKVIAESDDTEPLGPHLPLGYFQSKWVAERLVQESARRGLPVTVFRPGLICGDSQTGRSNLQDFLALLVQGCVQMKVAPDLDWRLDACPVDHIARCLVRLAHASDTLDRVIHLDNPDSRTWREVVLWMRIYGYSIDLIPFARWQEKLALDSRSPEHPLHALRSFFLAKHDCDDMTLAEFYQVGRHSRPCSERSRLLLARSNLKCPVVGPRELESYFESFVTARRLPAPAQCSDRIRRFSFQSDPAVSLQTLLRQHLDCDSLRILRIDKLHVVKHGSLITELTSWKSQSGAGLSIWRVQLAGCQYLPEVVDLFVKQKPPEDVVLEVAVQTASTCDRSLGVQFEKHIGRLGLTGGARREIALYAMGQKELQALRPRFYGAHQDPQSSHFTLFLQSLVGSHRLDATDDPAAWDEECVQAVLFGLSQIQSTGFAPQRKAQDSQPPCSADSSFLLEQFSGIEMSDMNDLWCALADYSSQFFSTWLGPTFRRIQQRWIEDLPNWWSELLQQPTTLCHNDFNPRNIALQRRSTGLQLKAFDWELATKGPPQHDLAEFLAFVLLPDHSPEVLWRRLDSHRQTLQRLTGCAFPRDSWLRGFELSLRQLMLTRFPLYCLAHTFRPLAFLERIIRTWQTMFRIVSSGH